MPEQETKVETVVIDYVCDKCESGIMERSGSAAYLTEPMQFPHKCNKCGFEQTFKEVYPKVGYRRVNG